MHYWKLKKKMYYRYLKDIVFEYNSTCRDLIKKGISHPMFYGNVIDKSLKFKSDTSELAKPLKNLIHKSYDLATIVDSSMQVYFDNFFL